MVDKKAWIPQISESEVRKNLADSVEKLENLYGSFKNLEKVSPELKEAYASGVYHSIFIHLLRHDIVLNEASYFGIGSNLDIAKKVKEMRIDLLDFEEKWRRAA